MIRTKLLCEKCNIEISKSNFKKHDLSCDGPKIKKIRGIDFDPNHGYKNGTRKAWNFGLTDETDKRVKSLNDKVRETKSKNDYSGWNHSDKTKETLSILACSRLAKHSKYSKNVEYKPGIILESSYEVSVAEILDELNIVWEKVRQGYVWNDNGKRRRYIPDFYIPKYNVFLDPKNDYLINKDKVKIESAMAMNNIVVHVLSASQINREYISSLFL